MAAANTKKRLAAAANRPRLLVYRLYSHSLAHIANFGRKYCQHYRHFLSAIFLTKYNMQSSLTSYKIYPSGRYPVSYVIAISATSQQFYL
jgi:hypothetical protein